MTPQAGDSLQGEFSSPLVLLGHCPSWEREKPCYSWVGVSVPAPYLTSLEGMLGCLSAGMVAVGMGLRVFCFLWCLSGVGWLLSKSSLSCQAVPSLALWLERAGSSLGIFLCVPTGISRFLRLQSLIWDSEAKRKPRACASVSFLGSRGPQTICLLPSTFQSLLGYGLYTMSRVLFVLKNRENYIYPIFQEEVSGNLFWKGFGLRSPPRPPVASALSGL